VHFINCGFVKERKVIVNLKCLSESRGGMVSYSSQPARCKAISKVTETMSLYSVRNDGELFKYMLWRESNENNFAYLVTERSPLMSGPICSSSSMPR
jgi:hypothetical protein